MERPTKRARLSPDLAVEENAVPDRVSTPLASLHRSITPPPRARSQSRAVSNALCSDLKSDQLEGLKSKPTEHTSTKISHRLISSPIQLTHIRDFPEQRGYNVDTVKLRDILGDPMIRECWQFNYLFDVDFLMSNFDEDVRSLVKVKVVHGSWERESANRVRVEEACSRYPNVEPIIAYMPERFGTHHSKMMILLRHDDLAQVVIHTANMIHGDWANMTQAVWRSPLLPLQKPGTPATASMKPSFATGARFKRDLLSYLKAYGLKKTGSLVQELNRFDFDSVRAALVASTPSKQVFSNLDSDKATLWGWPALRDLMSRILIQAKATKGSQRPTVQPHIAIQISSIASLGQTDKWLTEVFFKSLAPIPSTPQPKYSILFPTPDEIRRSLEGYGSGGSIHMKTQTAPQQKQLQYMRPHLCHWAGDGLSKSNCIDLSEETPLKREAGRARAAPHIKTYLRYTDAETMDSIDWAMVTSANLSTQAWGAGVNQNGEVRISSWEIGVVVWPELFLDEKTADSTDAGSVTALMVPCFKRDLPASSQPDNMAEDEARTMVGFRMPYDLPLTPYSDSDEPWCASASHPTPDWRGQSWIN
ncbi:uncharacterized protein N7496_009414 [Penicillium cataractarum]|uniref:Tyrosyl-DNA phosphodiesterase n=1 Tax=Penicillium cataractarum TaxID=2100454 RepID=A0A9W9V2F5_9EURO|nr:uncharacterized protein N7496_009414 [Penicillium cataractarum]KAJ5363701.1 hypothetical protein N7496_009414 [Penicillium cataractarum]